MNFLNRFQLYKSLIFGTGTALLEDQLNILDASREGDEDEDDILLEGETDIIAKLKRVGNVDNIRISYNQYADTRTKSACTLFAPLGVVSSIYNKTLTQKEIIELRDFAVKEYGYKVGRGTYFETGVRCVAKRWNMKYPDEQVVYFKTQQGTTELEAVLDKGYGATGGYRGNAKYNTDRIDGVLDGIDFGDDTYGHATSNHKIEGQKYCFDSIPQKMKYRFKNDPSKIKGWYRNCYVFLPEKELPSQVSKKIQAIRKKRGLDPFIIK